MLVTPSVDVLNAYADEVRFVQEQYHYLTGKRLDGLVYPEGRVKISVFSLLWLGRFIVALNVVSKSRLLWSGVISIVG